MAFMLSLMFKVFLNRLKYMLWVTDVKIYKMLRENYDI